MSVDTYELWSRINNGFLLNCTLCNDNECSDSVDFRARAKLSLLLSKLKTNSLSCGLNELFLADSVNQSEHIMFAPMTERHRQYVEINTVVINEINKFQMKFSCRKNTNHKKFWCSPTMWKLLENSMAFLSLFFFFCNYFLSHPSLGITPSPVPFRHVSTQRTFMLLLFMFAAFFIVCTLPKYIHIV